MGENGKWKSTKNTKKQKNTKNTKNRKAGIEKNALTRGAFGAEQTYR